MRNLRVGLAVAAFLAVPAAGQLAPSTQDGPASANLTAPKPDANGVYEVGSGVTSPVILEAVPVTTSDELRDSCTPLMVRVVAVVGADGALQIRMIVPAAGSPCSDAVAAALKQIQFQPGTLNDKPVPVAVCIRVPFQYLHPPVPHLVSCQGPGSLVDLWQAANDPLRLPSGARPPVPIHRVEAEMSAEARAEHVGGVVLVSMVVDEKGMPTDIRVERSAGRGLDENAVAAVSQYRFRPATLDRKPIPVRIRIEISFRFRN